MAISDRPRVPSGISARAGHIARAPGLPMYAQVYNSMRQDIENGVWKPGDLIPTEQELGRRFGVSAGTIKQAVLTLAREGLLTRRSGKGTHVTRLDLSRSLARFFRFRERDTGQDLSPVIRFIDAEVIKKPGKELLSKLGLAGTQSVLRLRRLMLHRDVPICVHISHIPYRLVRGLEDKDLTQATLYDILADSFGIMIVRAEEYLSAISASNENAALLRIPARHPVILIERTALTYRSAIVEWRQTIGRSDEFRYRTQFR